MAAEPVATQTKSLIDFFLAFLDWPFLFFVLLILFAYHFKDKISALLERGDIQISWGENKHIKLKDLSDGIDKEIDPLKEEIEALKEKLQELERSNTNETEQQTTGDNNSLSPQQISDAEKRIIDGLNNHKYRWRSVERLASISGINENEVLNILRSNPDVDLSMGKSKRQIAKLKNR